MSYYTRTEVTPYEDVTLQSARWLGYRGSHLEFCRVFTTEDSCERLKDIDRNDNDHRLRLGRLMEERASVESARIALRTSPTGILTAKMGIGETHDLAFSPYTHVFSGVEIEDRASANEAAANDLTTRLVARQAHIITTRRGNQRGLLSENWSAEENRGRT